MENRSRQTQVIVKIWFYFLWRFCEYFLAGLVLVVISAHFMILSWGKYTEWGYFWGVAKIKENGMPDIPDIFCL